MQELTTRTYLGRRLARAGLVAAVATLCAATGSTTAHAAHTAHAAPTTGQIHNAGGPTALTDSYIVVLKDHTVGSPAGHTKTTVTTTATTLAKTYGATIQHIWTDALNGFSAHLTEQAAKRLAANPAVAYVEQDHTVHIDTTQSPTPSWGLDRIDQRALPLDNSYNYVSTGTGVTAYVIDTGIRITHTDFAGRATYGYDAVDGSLPADDCNGSGTAMSGIIGGTKYGVAKNVRMIAVRVLDCFGSGTYSGVISGINWVTSHHTAGTPAVAYLGLGGALNASLNNAVATSIIDGVTYAVAAGNSNADACNYSPGSTPGALTTGATTSGDLRATYSNWGSCVDIYAPGTATTDWSTSDTATNTISGTGVAAAHVNGAGARVLQAHPTWTPAQVIDYLRANCVPLSWGGCLLYLPPTL